MIAVPTTLSAAEFNNQAGVTDAARRVKQSYLHPLAVPKAVILDPQATVATPMELLLSTGMRSMDHAVERWCATASLPLSDALSMHAMQMLASGLPKVQAAPQDLDARGDCQVAMWLSLLPHTAGVPFGASHGIGYILGGACGVPHGVTSCLMLPAVLEYWPGDCRRGAPPDGARRVSEAAPAPVRPTPAAGRAGCVSAPSRGCSAGRCRACRPPGRRPGSPAR